MNLIIEETELSRKLLIVKKDRTQFVNSLINYLSQHDESVHFMPYLPINRYQFQHIVFFIEEYDDLKLIKSIKKEKVIIITGNPRLFIKIIKNQKKEKFLFDKLINTDLDCADTNVIKQISWFIFGQNSKKIINFAANITLKKHADKGKKSLIKLKPISPKKIVLLLLFFLALIELFFVPPLLIASYKLYQAANLMTNQQIETAESKLAEGRKYLTISANAYQISKPLLSFFFVANFTDNIIVLHENSYQFCDIAFASYHDAKFISEIFSKENKTIKDIEDIENRIDKLTNQVNRLANLSFSLKEATGYNIELIKKINGQITQFNLILEDIKDVMPQIKTLLGKDKEMNYIIYFYNNTEIRPGGGFIGSFAKLTLYRYSIKELTVYDVYDADGQLTAHIEPPEAIRKYLNQPHWFLRDSNFDPDFTKNTKTAEFFLNKELLIDNIDGSIGITTTAVANIIGAYNDIFLPDYNEIITEDNFFIKTQMHIEEDKFAGSQKKKTILSSIVRMMILKINDASPLKLLESVKQSMDEKHLVIYIKNGAIQKKFDELRWSGKLIIPNCVVNNNNCVINHLFPVEANFGVNKVNFYIKRFSRLNISVNQNGVINNNYLIMFKNNSPPGIFPGGDYKNYFQIYIPKSSQVKKITINNFESNDYKIKETDNFTIVGILLLIKPQQSAVVNLEYSLNQNLVFGDNTFQLVIQKQIGLPNNDLTLEFKYPENIKIADKNYIGVEKNNNIVYNTTLSRDRIFIINLKKLK